MSYMIPSPMKYKEARTPAERAEVVNDPNVGVTLKKDGASYFLCKDEEGQVHLYSGGISKKTKEPIDKIDNVPHIKTMAELFLPRKSMLLGEICSRYDWKEGKWQPRSQSKYVTSIMGSKPPLAIKRQNETEPVEFYLFDIMFWDDEDWYTKDFQERHDKLQEVHDNIHLFFKSVEDECPWLTITKIITEDKEEQLSEWFFQGEEGAVCYRLKTDGAKNADYVTRPIGSPSLRRDHGVKIKTLSTFDVVVMGAEAPTRDYNGKYADTYEHRDEDGNPVNRLWALGMANAFVVGCYDENGELMKIGTVASGLTDWLRKDMADNLDDYKGRVIEVRCMSADSKSKALRHPVFLGFRDDKDATECTEDTIFNIKKEEKKEK